MIRVCAWCHQVLGHLDVPNMDSEAITHGICPACARKLLAEDSVSPLFLLRELKVPALLIQDDLRVRGANQSVCSALNKSLADIQGHYCGEVIYCQHSSKPGGCGHTQFCDDCAIRRAVIKTFKTGARVKAIAYPELLIDDSPQLFCFKIATEKIRDYVLLRIENIRAIAASA